ncbi:SAV_2336 N-terminal domain-related protein [Streptomyces flaveolus]|uniref:SAV_2336 N-terminal domain-related protein n=1 Tax=Streptomyces flaveolus TaxID=67297 RepID=UPI0033CC0E37
MPPDADDGTDDKTDEAGAEDDTSPPATETEIEDISGAPAPEEAPRALSVRIAHPHSLPGALAISRALRPLKRYRPDPCRTEIDEPATAAQMAHTGLLDVVTRPGRERWLDLALVVDDSMSMLLWQQLYRDLHGVFERLGAFRQIRSWGLRLEEGSPPRLSPRPFGSSRGLQQPAALDDPSGRTMTLVITDGVNPGWRAPAAAALLSRWATRGPTAVIHALPPRMWPGSAFSARRWSVRVPHPGAANSEWRVRDPLLPPELSRFTGRPVPVLEPRPRELVTWARTTVAGGSSAVLPLWDPGVAHGPTRHAAVTGDRAVRQFRRTASPEAYRLAAHLAAIAPLTVPVMRLVAAAVPWSATTAHLAEVFLGGLLRLAETMPPDTAVLQGTRGFLHNQRVFAFTDEASGILLDAVPAAEVVETARQVSTRIAELIGHAPEFAAWLNRPDGTDLLPEHAQNFAWLGSALLQRLGLTNRVTPEWDEPPTVPVEEPTKSRHAVELHNPDVGHSTSARSRFPWQPLSAQDPKHVGDYELLGWAPTSGPTSVYLGRNPEGVTAAVRRLAYNAANAKRLLLVEVAAVGRFDHPCLPVLFDHEAHSPRPWTAVSPVTTPAGGRAPDLNDIVTGVGPLSVDAVLSLAQRLASALAHSHGAGAVHGRLSPRHVLLTDGDPVLIGWHHATVDGTPAEPQTPVAHPADDLKALAGILAYAALGTEWPAPHPHRFTGRLRAIDESVWTSARPVSTVDPALHAVVRRCLRGPDGTTPTAETVLTLLRDRLPRHDAGAPGMREWFSPAVRELIGQAELRRTPPSVTLRDGPQVPVTNEEARTQAPPVKAKPATRIWELPPGAMRPTRKRRWPKRHTTPEELEVVSGPPNPCVAVISPHEASGRSTVAVNLAAALSGRNGAGRRDGRPVLMLPVHRQFGVFGYRLLDVDPAAVCGRLPADGGHMPRHARGWVTLTDSQGTQFLHGLVPANAVVRLEPSAVRRGIDRLRSIGTVVVDATGTFLPPGDSLRGLLGAVDHLVITTTGRSEHLDRLVEQLEWLARHGYEDQVRSATLVVSELDARTARTVSGGRAADAVDQVCTVPYDDALHERGLVDHSSLSPATRQSFADLAHVVCTALEGRNRH